MELFWEKDVQLGFKYIPEASCMLSEQSNTKSVSHSTEKIIPCENLVLQKNVSFGKIYVQK